MKIYKSNFQFYLVRNIKKSNLQFLLLFPMFLSLKLEKKNLKRNYFLNYLLQKKVLVTKL